MIFSFLKDCFINSGHSLLNICSVGLSPRCLRYFCIAFMVHTSLYYDLDLIGSAMIALIS